MAIESFTFDDGMNRKKGTLALKNSELYHVSGFGYFHDGYLEARTSKTRTLKIDSTSTSTINGIHKYSNSVYATSHGLCPGKQVYFNYVYHSLSQAPYTKIGLLQGNIRPRFVDYEGFTIMVDGEWKKAYIEGNEYEWGVANPVSAPILTAGAAPGPTGTYQCYVTFYIVFPNGRVVETGFSPVAELVTVNQKIEWSGIPICPYQGNELKIYRRLWRAVTGVPYLLATLTDNVTTIFSDGAADSTLVLNEGAPMENYHPPPDNLIDIVIHLQRIFGIKDNRLYWTEPYYPFSHIDTNNVVVTKRDTEELVSLIQWGDQLWMVSVEEWYRLLGSDPTTWAIKRTFTDTGIINRNTLKKSRYGMIGRSYDGIYLFDGSTQRDLTDKKFGKYFFNAISDPTVEYAEFDGSKYYLYFASSGSTIDSCMVIDFTPYPEYRVYLEDFVPDAVEFYKNTNHKYIAKCGYEWEEGGAEIIPTSFITGYRGFEGILRRKVPKYLYYDIDTNGVDTYVSIYVDGVLGQTLTLNTTSRVRNRSEELKMMEGYSFALEFTCSNSQYLKVYAPWALEADPVGI